MGLFDKMFEKKYCDICGEKIGLLGNRKLEDGNCCKECAAKLSPWFSERRSSTIQEIKEQLAYREENQRAVSDFHTTRTLGRYTKIYLDEGAGKFMVSSANDLEKANPDVLDFSQYTGCDLEIKESRNELKRKDSEGKSISYNPPRYEYSYNFYVTINVNHPYFDDMRFMLNGGSVKTGEKQMGTYGGGSSWTVSRPIGLRESGIREYEEYIRMGEEIKQALENMRNGAAAPAQQVPENAGSAVGTAPGAAGAAAYGAAYGGGQKQETVSAATDSAVHMQSVKCPWCGAVVQSDGKGSCELCGGPL